jgi:hypothetical protein
MSYPDPIYRRCVVCGRSFRVEPAELRRRASMFCTLSCFWKSWRVFRRALQEGLLEQFLSLPVVREWLEEDTRTARQYGTRRHNRKLLGNREW